MNQKENLIEARTALIIDDENDICFLLSNILRKNNLKVNYVHSLAEGIVSLEMNEPSILFLDNYLPDGLGMDFIQFVKTAYATIKIVMVSAHDTPEDRKNALQKGVNIFIAKPFTPDQITNALKNLYTE